MSTAATGTGSIDLPKTAPGGGTAAMTIGEYYADKTYIAKHHHPSERSYPKSIPPGDPARTWTPDKGEWMVGLCDCATAAWDCRCVCCVVCPICAHWCACIECCEAHTRRVNPDPKPILTESSSGSGWCEAMMIVLPIASLPIMCPIRRMCSRSEGKVSNCTVGTCVSDTCVSLFCLPCAGIQEIRHFRGMLRHEIWVRDKDKPYVPEAERK